MAVILFEEGADPLLGKMNGDCFQSVDGRVITRRVVTPVRPGSASQLAEVNGVVRGAKFFGNGLTTGEQAAAFGNAGGGDAALSIITGVLSSIYEGDVPDLPIDILIGSSGTPVIGSPAICPTTTSLTAALTLTSAIGDERGWFAASRPMSPGRVPRIEDTRVIHRGFSFPVILDVGAKYLGRFGAMQPSGVMMLAARAVSASAGAASGIVSVLVTLGCGSDADCDVDSPVIIPGPFGSTGFGGSVNFASAGALSQVNWAIADTSFSVSSGTGFINGGSFFDNLGDLTGVPRTSNTTFVYTLAGTSETCSVPIQITVQPGIGP